MLIRGGPSAKVSAAFEERDAESAGGEGRTGGQSRQTTSDHGYVGSLCPGLGHQDRRLRKPFPRMTSFSRVLSATLPLNTSYWRLSILSRSLREMVSNIHSAGWLSSSIRG